MGRRQGSLFERKEVMDLMHQRLNGSIKSLRELKDRIAEETGEQIALTTLWQQIHKLREQPPESRAGYLRVGTSHVSKIDGSQISIREEDDTMLLTGTAVKADYSTAVGTSVRRSARASKRRSYSPTPALVRPDQRKSHISATSGAVGNITVLPYTMKSLRMQKKEKIIKRRKLDEPKNWDREAEELIRQEALKHEEEAAEDPLAKAKSKVWLFCEKLDEDGESKAKCRICGMVMLRKLGSTRAMLRHLRKMHGNLIEGIIRPVSKRVTAIAGKPRGDNSFDIDDDTAWVEEVDEEDFDDYDEPQYTVPQQCVGKGNVVTYNSYVTDEGGPSYNGEVFIRENGSYVDGEEFVDVVYVQDENSYEQIISKSNDESLFVGNSLHSGKARNEGTATVSLLKRSISDSELAQPPSRNTNNILERYDGTNLETTVSRSIKNLNLLDGREKERRGNIEEMNEVRFSRIITTSIRTFPPEQREHVRYVIMQCIEELRNAELAAEEAEVPEINEELIQISDV